MHLAIESNERDEFLWGGKLFSTSSFSFLFFHCTSFSTLAHGKDKLWLMRPKTKPVADALGAFLKKSYQNMKVGGERKDFVEGKELKEKRLRRKSSKKMFLRTNGKEME